MDYHFFDYKYNIKGFGSDLFGAQHLIYIVLIFILTPLLSFLLRKTDHKKISIFLKAMSIITLLFEVIKISWESYYDITTGRGFNVEGLIPIYSCSLFIYALLISAWGGGKAKDVCLSYLSTLNLIFGAIGVVYCNGLNYYPFWTFGAFYSLFFHSSMFVTSVFLLMTGYKKLQWSDVIQSYVPIVILSLVAVPIDYIVGTDYMQLFSGSGVPLYETLAKKLANANLRFVYTAIMLVTYLPLSAIVVGAYKLIRLAFTKHKK